MSRPFDCFVILAEMRTGSNFLESNLDAFDGLKCYGEAFNPAFVVAPNRSELFGMTQAERDRDPLALLERMKRNTRGIPGFRFFHDHDPRVFEAIMADRRCAKVVLTRNVVESYVSHRIARATDQWRLGDLRNARTARVRFDAEEFERMFLARKEFQQTILRKLQTSGQTAFYLDYEDLQNLDVINGLGRFLGETKPLAAFTGKTKKQNPQPLSEKVSNFEEMQRALAAIDVFDLGRLPNFEPRRGPVIPSWIASDDAGLLFMPVPGGPTEAVRRWLEGLSPRGAQSIATGFTQKSLRQWKRRYPGHRSFTVIAHPVVRLYRAFCTRIASTGPGSFVEIRRTLERVYGLSLPAEGRPWTRDDQRAAFIAFAGWVRGNLNGQTSIRVAGPWASQGRVIEGFGRFVLPDRIAREETLAGDLGDLAAGAEPPTLPVPEAPFALAEIYDEAVEKAVRAAYQRDYMLFGFGPWKG